MMDAVLRAGRSRKYRRTWLSTRTRHADTNPL